jgi:hypothetical protein
MFWDFKCNSTIIAAKLIVIYNKECHVDVFLLKQARLIGMKRVKKYYY